MSLKCQNWMTEQPKPNAEQHPKNALVIQNDNLEQIYDTE